MTGNVLHIKTEKSLQKGNIGWINMNLVADILIPMFLAHKPKTFFFPQTNCNKKVEESECIATTPNNSILAPVYPSCLKLSARTFHPFLFRSLLTTLPAYHPLLGIIFFFLIPSVQQGNKNGSY